MGSGTPERNYQYPSVSRPIVVVDGLPGPFTVWSNAESSELQSNLSLLSTLIPADTLLIFRDIGLRVSSSNKGKPAGFSIGLEPRRTSQPTGFQQYWEDRAPGKTNVNRSSTT
jgi:hypothetical protein